MNIRSLAATLLAAAVMFGGASARADDEPAFISLGAAAFDMYKGEDLQVEYRLEYRGKKLLGPIKPVLAAAGTLCPGNIEGAFNFCPGDGVTGSGFFGGGGMMDFFWGRRIVVSPSLGVFGYTGGTDDLDLDSPVVFRYQVEAAYRFDNRSRLGFALSRYDNFGIGDTNPGAFSFTMYYSMPTTMLFGK